MHFKSCVHSFIFELLMHVQYSTQTGTEKLLHLCININNKCCLTLIYTVSIVLYYNSHSTVYVLDGNIWMRAALPMRLTSQPNGLLCLRCFFADAFRSSSQRSSLKSHIEIAGSHLIAIHIPHQSIRYHFNQRKDDPQCDYVVWTTDYLISNYRNEQLQN